MWLWPGRLKALRSYRPVQHELVPAHREREREQGRKAGRVSLVHLAPTRRPTDRPTVALIIMQHVSRRAILVLFSLVNIECAASLIMRPSVNAMVARRHGNVRIAAAAAEPEPEAPAQPVLRRSRPIGVLGPKVLTKVFTYRVCAILLGTLGGFTAAFAWLENWHWLDALYYVLTTAATVGFGDFRPSNLAGRVLTVALSLVGTGLVGGLLAGLLGEWRRRSRSSSSGWGMRGRGQGRGGWHPAPVAACAQAGRRVACRGRRRVQEPGIARASRAELG